MTLDERVKQIVVDTMRTWPKKMDAAGLLKQLDTLAQRVKAAALEEKS